MEKKEKKTIIVSAILHGSCVSGFLLKSCACRRVHYVIYYKMTDLVEDFPLDSHVIKIDGCVREQDILSLAVLWDN